MGRRSARPARSARSTRLGSGAPHTWPGGRDSEQVRLARGLLSDSETKVMFRQPPAELALVRDLCRLSERETAIVASLPKGLALWKVGNRSFQVEHMPS